MDGGAACNGMAWHDRGQGDPLRRRPVSRRALSRVCWKHPPLLGDESRTWRDQGANGSLTDPDQLPCALRLAVWALRVLPVTLRSQGAERSMPTALSSAPRGCNGKCCADNGASGLSTGRGPSLVLPDRAVSMAISVAMSQSAASHCRWRCSWA